MKKLIGCLLFLVFTPLVVNAQSAQEPLADQIESMLKNEVFEVGLLLQSQAVFSFKDDQFNGGRRFQLGAVFLDLRGRVDSNFDYRLQLNFRSTPSILDAHVGYRVSDRFQLVAGAFRPFLSLDLDPSPGDLDFINRARQVGAMMNMREIGLTALGNVDGFNYSIGMYNGYGLTAQNDNRFLYTARFGYTVDNQESTLGFGFNGALNTSRFEPVGNTGITSTGDRKLYGFFAKYDSDRWFGTAEFLQTLFERADILEEETITGFYVTIGNRITEKDELLFRWDHISFDIQTDSSNLLVFGWNHQATRLISFQTNLLARIDDNNDNQFGLAGNFQFQF